MAEVGGRAAGHIAFSTVTISDGSPGWYGIGPVSVLPELQKQGIGTALMREGLSRIKSMGAEGCALVGDPEYYTRFGFRNIQELVHEGVPPENFLVLPFGDATAAGIVTFHEGFAAASRPTAASEDAAAVRGRSGGWRRSSGV